MDWPRPVGLVLADGTAAHHACDERAKAERARRRGGASAPSPERLGDEAEVPSWGESLP